MIYRKKVLDDLFPELFTAEKNIEDSAKHF